MITELSRHLSCGIQASEAEIWKLLHVHVGTWGHWNARSDQCYGAATSPDNVFRAFLVLQDWDAHQKESRLDIDEFRA